MRRLEAYFRALGDSNRLRILNLLLHGELCGCDIQYVLGISQPNVSRHLAYLKQAGLVLDRREGYRVFYRLAGEGERIQAALLDFLRFAFARESVLHNDLRRLKRAIRRGACTLEQIEPPPRFAVGSGRARRRLGRNAASRLQGEG